MKQKYSGPAEGCPALRQTDRGIAVKALVLYGLLVAFVCASSHLGAQDDPEFARLEQAYQPGVRPLLKRYCYKCHSGDDAEAELDPESFATMKDVQRSPKAWLKVREMLDSRQMPPRDAKQPTDDERSRLQTWVRT